MLLIVRAFDSVHSCEVVSFRIVILSLDYNGFINKGLIKLIIPELFWWWIVRRIFCLGLSELTFNRRLVKHVNYAWQC